MACSLNGLGVYFLIKYTNDHEHFCGDKADWYTGYYDDDNTPLRYCLNCGEVD